MAGRVGGLDRWLESERWDGRQLSGGRAEKNSHQQTGFTAGTIANDNELPADLSHNVGNGLMRNKQMGGRSRMGWRFGVGERVGGRFKLVMNEWNEWEGFGSAKGVLKRATEAGELSCWVGDGEWLVSG